MQLSVQFQIIFKQAIVCENLEWQYWMAHASFVFFFYPTPKEKKGEV
jgi:hypothetical protein